MDEVVKKRGVKKIVSSIEKQLDMMLFGYEGREVNRTTALQIVKNICSVDESVPTEEQSPNNAIYH
jgi:hypothetical protein